MNPEWKEAPCQQHGAVLIRTSPGTRNMFNTIKARRDITNVLWLSDSSLASGQMYISKILFNCGTARVPILYHDDPCFFTDTWKSPFFSGIEQKVIEGEHLQLAIFFFLLTVLSFFLYFLLIYYLRLCSFVIIFSGQILSDCLKKSSIKFW